MGLSVSQYQELRLTNMEHGLEYPPRNEVVAYKSCLHPPLQVYELKSCVEIGALYENTVEGLLDIIGLDRDDERDVLLYDINGKFGADGSGAH